MQQASYYCMVPLWLGSAVLSVCILIILGLLSWQVPLYLVQQALEPISLSARGNVLAEVKQDVSFQWSKMHAGILQRWIYWNEMSQDPLELHKQWIQLAYPLLLTEKNVIGIPLVTVTPANCVLITSLIHSASNWIIDRQNCTHRWLQAWNNVTKTPTAFIGNRPVATADLAGLIPPVSLTSPEQPFTWGPIRSPQSGVGDFLEANVVFFTNKTMMGRASLAVSTGYLVTFLKQVLLDNKQATGGRLVVYEPNGVVVAATHGNPEVGRRYNLTETKDFDLGVAWRYLLKTHNSLCPTIQEAVDGSVPLLLDVGSIYSDQASVLDLHWCVLLMSPRVNTFGRLDDAGTIGIIFVLSTTVGATMLAFVMSLLFGRRLRRLADGMLALAEYDITKARTLCGRQSRFQELDTCQASYDFLVDAMDAFGHYVPRTLVRCLLNGTLIPELGMKPCQVTVLFMDMENFTSVCELNDMEDVITITSEVFDVCVKEIEASSGTVDKFMGDCIMAFWGAPIAVALPTQSALDSTLRMMNWLGKFDKIMPTSQHKVGFRMGMHCGKVLVGHFGATSRWDYTVTGDVVNTAARLEPLNKHLGTRTVVSEDFRAELDSDTQAKHFRPLGAAILAGKKHQISIHEVLEQADSGLDADLDHQAWALAVHQFTNRQFDQAERYFQTRPVCDMAAQMLLADIQEARTRNEKGQCLRYMKYGKVEK